MLRFWPHRVWLSAASVVLTLASSSLTPTVSRALQPLSPTPRPVVQDEPPEQIPLTGLWQFVAEPPSVPSSTLSLVPGPQRRPPTAANWQPITVPANWYLTGHDLSGAVWYRYRFPSDPRLRDALTELVFAGVDYAADVWLNGQYLGFHEGYFQPFRFNISHHLAVSGTNELWVRVNSPKEIETPDWSLHKRLIKGVLGHHDARPGGAWTRAAQDLNTGGIWAPVYLKVSHQGAIEQVQVTPQLMPNTGAGVANSVLTLNWSGKTATTVEVQWQLSPDNFAGSSEPLQRTTVLVRPGVNRIALKTIAQHPQLWETWDQGTPNLYALTVQIHQNNRQLDQAKTVFGFRTIAFDPHAKVWLLNGKRMFLRGTNYIGSQWLSEMTPDKYRTDLDLMQKANINTVRVHAHIAGQAFYDQCDRAGILVWQDFPLQWGYTDAPAFAREAIAQAKDMVTLLYNHPSIIAWSLHNEPPWDATWMKYKYKSYNPQQNRELDRQLYANLRNFDPTRYMHPYSGVNEHPWFGWYSNTYAKYAEPTTEPIIAEFGAQALPNLRSLRRIFAETDLWPTTEAQWQKWEYHNFQRHETFDLAKVSMGQNPQAWVDNTQRYQADLNKFAAEAYRRQRYQPVSAIFQFMFGECWPSINWGMVDYWRNPKPGYFALQQAYQPILPMIDNPLQSEWPLGKTVQFKLSVVNDLWQGFPQARLTYALLKDGLVVFSKTIAAPLEPDSIKSLKPIAYVPLSAGHYELQLRVIDAQNRFLSQNAYALVVSSVQP